MASQWKNSRPFAKTTLRALTQYPMIPNKRAGHVDRQVRSSPALPQTITNRPLIPGLVSIGITVCHVQRLVHAVIK